MLVGAIAHHHRAAQAPPQTRAIAQVLVATDVLARLACEQIDEAECWERIVLPEGLDAGAVRELLDDVLRSFEVASKAL